MADQEIAGLVVKLEATTAQFRRQMADADKAVASATSKIDKELAKVDSAFDRAGQSAQRASQMLKAAMGLVVAGGVGGLLKQAEAYTTISNRLKLVTSSSEELAQAQAAVFSIAQKGGQPLAATAELYQRIASNQKELKLTGEGVAGIVDTISKAMVISGTSAAGAQAALVQLGQAFASGTLRGEELNAVLEQAPALAQAIAAGMGKTVGELRALGSEGKLTADAVVSALQSQADAVDKQFRTMADTVGAAMTRVGNAVTQYIGQADAATGTSAALAGAITTIAEHVDTVASIMAGAGVAAAALYANKLAAAAVAAHTARSANIAQADSLLQAAIANQRAAQTATIRAAAEAQAARGTAVQTAMSIQLAQARTKEAAATHAVTVAQAGLRTASAGVLAALGGPVGLAVLAGTAATAFLMFRDNADEAKVSADSLAGSVRELSSAADVAAKRYAALLSSVDNFSKAQLAERYKELTGQLKIAEAQLKSFTRQYEKGVGSQGMVSGAKAAVDALKAELARLDELRVTGSGQVNKEYDKLLASLEKQAALQGVNSEAAKVRYAIEKGELGELGSAQEAALIRYAEEIDAKKALEESGRRSASATKDQIKALDALVAKYDPAAKAQAEYEKVIALADQALKDGTYTTEQYQKVVQGLYVDLNKPIWDKHNKQADEAAAAIKKVDDALESVRDRLDPVRAATKRLTAEQKLLKDGLDAGLISFDEYQLRLRQLEDEYDANTRATSEWAQWTESSLERVDSAFADAWRNIGDGFAGFRDSLTNAFKQMLAELAHLAITRPIVMQIGAAMGIGGGAGQAVSMMGGTAGSGGLDAFSLLKNGYSIANSGFGQAVMGGWNSGQGVWGGLQNAASSGWQYGSSALGSMFGSGGSGVMVDGVYQLGANTMPATVDLIGNTVSQGGNIIGTASGATTTATTWGSAATGLGSIMGGLSGAYMGYQNAGAKGAVAGGLGGWGGGTLGTMAGTAAAAALSGTAMGAAIGSILPGIGTVIGAALGAAFGSKLFGGAWETKDAGLAFSVTEGDFLGQQYEYQKKKGGLFSSNKKRTRFSALDDETAARFQSVYDATEDTVAGLFESLSYSVEEASLAGLQLARTKISTKGKTEEEIQEAISEWFLSLGNSMTAELNKVFATGLDYDLAGMQAFVGNLQGVNEVLRYLDVSMYDMTVTGGKLAESLSAAAGGMDALSANVATYYQSFFSAAEQQEKTLQALIETFEDADHVLAGSRQDYRDMVEAIDVTTESGSELFNTLMALSGQAAAYYDILEAKANEAIGLAGNAFSALQASINAEVGELQKQYQAAQSSASGLLQLSNSLQSALRSMRLESDEFDRLRRQQAQAQLSAALAIGRAGGSLQGMDLSDALSELGRANTDLFGTFEEYARDYWRTANDINSLDKLTGDQLSVEEKTLEAIEGQYAYYDQMLLDAQNELNALMGIDTSVQSVAAALASFKVAVGAAQTAKDAANPKTTKSVIADTYQSVFGRKAGSGELNYWLQRIGEGTATTGNLADLFKTSDEYKKGGFATGGYTGAGGKWDPAGIVHKGEVVWSQSDIAKWGGVGAVEAMRKNGPELEVTGPSRIYNASQTAAMLGGGDSTAAIASLQRTVEGQSAALKSIAKHTMQTAKRVEFLERWDFDGLPKERDVA